jgi:hypothetical protein
MIAHRMNCFVVFSLNASIDNVYECVVIIVIWLMMYTRLLQQIVVFVVGEKSSDFVQSMNDSSIQLVLLLLSSSQAKRSNLCTIPWLLFHMFSRLVENTIPPHYFKI